MQHVCNGLVCLQTVKQSLSEANKALEDAGVASSSAIKQIIDDKDREVAAALGQMQRLHDAVAGEANECVGGIGLILRVEEGKLIKVKSVVEGGAADRSDQMRIGDAVLKVDGRDCAGMNNKQVSGLIMGAPGTRVCLLGLREKSGERYTVSLIRGEGVGGGAAVEVHSVAEKIADDGCAAAKILREEIEKLRAFVVRLEKDLRERNSALDAVSAMLEVRERERDVMAGEMESEKVRADDAEAGLKSALDRYNKFSAELESVCTELQDRKEKCILLQEEVRRLNSEGDALRGVSSELETSHLEMESVKASLQVRTRSFTSSCVGGEIA